MGAYGVTKEEATRFGLPCGGTLRLVQERVLDTGWIAQVLQRTSAHRQCSQRDKATKHFLGQKNPQGASAAGFGRQVTVDVTRLWVHQPW
jgi:xanthine/CO dehydrogenase XdhC/CoxF family maturation factor